MLCVKHYLNKKQNNQIELEKYAREELSVWSQIFGACCILENCAGFQTNFFIDLISSKEFLQLYWYSMAKKIQKSWVCSRLCIHCKSLWIELSVKQYKLNSLEVNIK